MPQGPPSSWLPWLMARLTYGLSATLVALVLLSPLFDRGRAALGRWDQVIALFAGDTALRHTALASALGLAVTARVFFRPGAAVDPARRKAKPPR